MATLITITVPSTFQKTKPIDNTPYVTGTKQFLASKFGGFTAYNGAGGFVLENGELCEEPVTVVTSFSTKRITPVTRKLILDYGQYLATIMEQESILIQIGAKVYFIEPC